jgi:hypothetical protein
LDLRGIDHRHEPDPQFRAALQRRVAAILSGTDPGPVTEARDLATIDLEPHLATPGTPILAGIADQEPDTETEIVMLTEDTPRSRRWLFASAAAAVIAIIGATVIAFAVNTSSDDDSTTSPTAVATVAPASTLAPTTTVATAMETVRFDLSSANMPVTFTVPDDWTLEGESSSSGWAHNGLGMSEVGLIFAEIQNIYADGCQWTPVDPPVGPTVDDLAQAWANLPQYNASAAVDVTVDGYTGKQIGFTVPDYNIGECRGADFPVFGLWTEPGNAFPGFDAQGPNQHIEQRILDVDGTRLVITAYYLPTASPQDRADLEEALASIQIG